jgi:CRISPR/Cas system-associated protein endoribonuclease Cas2
MRRLSSGLSGRGEREFFSGQFSVFSRLHRRANGAGRSHASGLKAQVGEQGTTESTESTEKVSRQDYKMDEMRGNLP